VLLVSAWPFARFAGGGVCGVVARGEFGDGCAQRVIALELVRMQTLARDWAGAIAD
jgi:hypothetical protein